MFFTNLMSLCYYVLLFYILYHYYSRHISLKLNILKSYEKTAFKTLKSLVKETTPRHTHFFCESSTRKTFVPLEELVSEYENYVSHLPQCILKFDDL